MIGKRAGVGRAGGGGIPTDLEKEQRESMWTAEEQGRRVKGAREDRRKGGRFGGGGHKKTAEEVRKREVVAGVRAERVAALALGYADDLATVCHRRWRACGR
jgi:hypothetical protein